MLIPVLRPRGCVMRVCCQVIVPEHGLARILGPHVRGRLCWSTYTVRLAFLAEVSNPISQAHRRNKRVVSNSFILLGTLHSGSLGLPSSQCPDEA